MPKAKHEQMDFKGLELVADEFTGTLNGSVSGALTGQVPVTVTYTSGAAPTANGAVTVADSAAPSVTELLEFCVELNAKIAAIQAALD